MSRAFGTVLVVGGGDLDFPAFQAWGLGFRAWGSGDFGIVQTFGLQFKAWVGVLKV